MPKDHDEIAKLLKETSGTLRDVNRELEATRRENSRLRSELGILQHKLDLETYNARA